MRNRLLITAQRFDHTVHEIRLTFREREAYECGFVENGLCFAQIKNKTCHALIHHLESLIREIQVNRENVMFNKLTSVFYASVLLLIMNFAITLSK